ncbi:hypothetical protein FA95DRAFT_1570391 [Auriscalpium vulgare]|uniref:Uncharacterized protein n=1 Tax=Auriscalpium vulgare TaxID=40419 RepID=A0ACB8S439_9AGAM|nr:hypothetical protein FA95DRAFT_1570391 [Auriscalpium vulgare]
MAARIAIPLELIFAILEAIPGSTDSPTADRATLCACALVCHAWSVRAQAVLLRRVHVQQGASPVWRTRLMRTLGVRPPLGAHIRTLGVRLAGDGLRGALTAAHFAALLARCPALEHLAVDMCLLPTLGAGPIAAVAALLLNVRSLEWRRARSDSVVLFELLGLWTGCLRALRLASMDTVPVVAPDILPPPALHEISTDSGYNDVSPVLRWLLQPAAGAPPLRVLDIGVYPDDIRDILEAHGPHLHSLTLHRQPPPWMALGSLLELIVRQEPTAPLTVPPSVRHLGFYPTWAEDGRHSLARFCKALSEHQNVRVVSINRQVSPANEASLREICRVRGIQFINHRLSFPVSLLVCSKGNTEWMA